MRRRDSQDFQNNSSLSLNEPGLINDLLQEILKVIQNPTDHHTLSDHIFQTPLSLFVLEKKKPIYYANSITCIQVIEQDCKCELDPFNRKTTQYYHPHHKPHIVFNCHESAITEEASKWPNPYEPCYFYKDYVGFKEKRKKVNIILNCDQVIVKKWSVKIVNISGSGYYAPVLLIREKERKKQIHQLTERVQNILFEKQLKGALEKMRVKDMKRCHFQVPENIMENSLFYSFKNKKINHSQSRGQNSKKGKKAEPFAVLDTKKRILQCSHEPFAYLPMGDLQGNYKFLPFVPEKYVKKTHDYINFEKYHPPQIAVNEEPEKFYANQELWSSESEASEDHVEDFRNSFMEDENEEQESDEEEQDILRTIYKKKLDQK